MVSTTAYCSSTVRPFPEGLISALTASNTDAGPGYPRLVFLHDFGPWLRSYDDGGPAGALLAADGVGTMWMWMGMPVAVGQGQFDLQQGPPSFLCEWH